MTSPIFLDTNCFIYLVEDHPVFAPKIAPVFKKITEGSLDAVTSVITVSEVLVAPIKLENQELITKYHNVFTHVPSLRILSPSYKTAIAAARISATYGLKLPDSYQLAIAQEAGCTSFVTNDESLRKYKEMEVVLIRSLDTLSPTILQ